MNEEFIPTLTHATERDIDLVLVEELYSSFDFTSWIAVQAGIEKPVARWDVKHSKRRTQSRREIDIFIEIEHADNSRSAVLIENKLDAGEQPDQAESYEEELEVLAKGYGVAKMIIVCPRSYGEQHQYFTSKFNAVVTYEQLRGWFRDAEDEVGDDLILRYRLRNEFLDQAIHKHRRGYTPVLDTVVGDFNAQYVALLRRIAPKIIPGSSMLKKANPRESTSMIFDQNKTLAALPKHIRPRRFSHELGRGLERRANYVAVTFAGWGAALPAIKKQLESDTADLEASFFSKPPTKTRPNPGLVMSIPSEPVDNQGNFADQSEKMIAGMKTALILRDWLIANQHILLKWSDLVKSSKVV